MIVLSYGLPGMGKTLWMHDYLKRNLALGYRWLVMDHADEWADPQSPHWRGRAPPLKVIDPDDSKPDLEAPGVYVFQNGWGFERVAELAASVGNAVYVDDELDFAAEHGGWLDNPLRVITHQGRHLRTADGTIKVCHILGACRRPQSLHSDVSGQALHVAIFRVQGDLTLDRLVRDNHIWKAERPLVETLPKFRYREWFSEALEARYVDLAPIGYAEPRRAEPRTPQLEEQPEEFTFSF